jgi:hypothetical protein
MNERRIKMGAGKRALMCVFRPAKLKTTLEMQEWFAGSYPRFLEMETVEFKCWWCDQEKGEWGAFYVFESERALNDYVASDIWQKVVPEKYGCVPTWRAVEPGPVLSKKIVTSA